MKKVLGILVLSLLFGKSCFSAEKYGDIIKRQSIEGNEFVITQEVTYQQLWKVDTKNNLKKSIKKAFSIERFAKNCEMIVTAELDLNRVIECQNAIPVLDNDRNFD